MSTALFRSGENVSEYFIGHFKDARLATVGALLFKRVCEQLTTCIKSLGGNRALEVAFGRFLGNSRVNVATISQSLAEKTNAACLGKHHVLCLQDTVQLTYPNQDAKKNTFGPTGDADTKGIFSHPGIIVDASNKDVLGVSSIIAWCRSNEVAEGKNKNRPIEEKESIRWIDTALSAKKHITEPKIITVIGDRESDILEVFQRVPDKKTHLIVRASHDRNLTTGEKISEHLSGIETAGIHEIDLPAITGKRKPRRAQLSVKFSPISFYDRSKDKIVEVNCVSAVEMSPVPTGESPIGWVLLTTHSVTRLEDAMQILVWYTWRWVIEQVFRTMKNKGLKIEDSQIETPEKLLTMSCLSIAAAVKVMSLVEARAGNTTRLASDFFSKDEIKLLLLICIKLEGNTKKQKNPHKKESLSWVSWIIARLGGWNGYASESPPGPITMLKGLKKFDAQFEGWLFAQ